MVSILSIFSFFKIYLIPFIVARSQTFTPIGSLLDQAIYLGLLLPIALYFTRDSNKLKSLGFIAISIVILIGLLLTVYQLFNPPTPGQKIIILPFETGLQPAFAVSETELLATGSAGIATISANLSEVTIINNLVTEQSLIYISPVGTPSAQAPFLMRQLPEESFTVGIQTPSGENTPFNWLIIN